MDIASFIGLFGGFAIIIFGAVLGGSARGLFHVPSLLITVGGSYLTLFLTYPLSYAVGVFRVIARVFHAADFHEREIVQRLYALAEKGRRTGLLALEEEIQDFDDDFVRTGLRNVVDGVDGDAIKALMESELTHMEDRHNTWISLLNSWAALAPGYGMLGTVMGLIGMLATLEDKSSLGSNMATALITTFYGSLVQNWFITPVATKLQYQHDLEVKSKEMVIEGVLSIQAGDHPRVLAQRLLTYLSPKMRKELEMELIKD